MPNRLTKIALYPNLNEYLRDEDQHGRRFCDFKNLDFFPTYTRDQCLEECRYKKIMEECQCRPPYLPEWKHLPKCTFKQHSVRVDPAVLLA